jgi:putative transposase
MGKQAHVRCSARSPTEVWATLLDEGTYLASERTMYRLLAADGPVRDRRDQLTHPPYARPELLAERPNEVWSWDITKLHDPRRPRQLDDLQARPAV